MADPLSLLREYNINKKHIIEKNNQIVFGEYAWPKTAKTNYIVFGSGKNGTPKNYYTLECLLFFLKNLKSHHPVYVQEANAQNVPFIRRPDRKKLLAYLNGETNTSPSIDSSVPVESPTCIDSSVPIDSPTTVENDPEEQDQQKVDKKHKLENQQEECEISESEKDMLKKKKMKTF